MSNRISEQTAPLVKGLGLVVGEIVFGVNGMFLFSRFGLGVPESAVAGVLVGAAVGYCIAAGALAIRRREPAPARASVISVKARA